MSPDLLALVDKPLLLMGLLFVGGMLGIALERFSTRLRRKAWRDRNGGNWNRNRNEGRRDNVSWLKKPDAAGPRQPDAADQLRIVMGAEFTVQPLLNKSEARVFREVDRIVIGCHPDWQVMAQVSVGEILRSKDVDAYRCINSKRIDLLLVDGDCNPRHAIEYQGGGHYQGTAAARDAVKKEALRRAGIGYHEVVAGQTKPTELRWLIEKLVDKPNKPPETN